MINRSASRGLLPAAAIALSAFAGLAEAADLGPYPRGGPVYAPQPAYYPQTFRWSGFYAGIQAGYGWGGTDAVSSSIFAGAPQSFSYPISGGIGGVHAGYNWQAGNFVFGLESDLESSGITGSGIGTLGGGHITSIDWLGSIRGRFGLAAGRSLFYVTGGLAYGDVSTDRSAGAGFTAFTGGTGWKTGWTLGGGLEHAFSQNITVRLEYRYTDLGQVTFTSPANGITDTSDVSHSAVRAGVSFKF